jgi:hypothetical protein
MLRIFYSKNNDDIDVMLLKLDFWSSPRCPYARSQLAPKVEAQLMTAGIEKLGVRRAGAKLGGGEMRIEAQQVSGKRSRPA